MVRGEFCIAANGPGARGVAVLLLVGPFGPHRGGCRSKSVGKISVLRIKPRPYPTIPPLKGGMVGRGGERGKF